MEKIVEVNSLTKIYYNYLILDNISFEVKKGEFLAIVGQNGVGKTTLIESILDLKTSSNKGIQFQDSAYQSKILVKELCEFTKSYYKKSVDMNELLEKFYLADKKGS